jgi:hypothetical protein
MTLKYIKKLLILALILLGLSYCNGRRSSGNLSNAYNNSSALLPDIQIGFASVNITPPAGMRLCGTFEERLSIGVHDSLFVRAFVFKQGDVQFAIAGCDLAMVFPEVCDVVRERVEVLGLIPDHVLIHGSETHNGPDYFGEFRDVFHERAIKEYGHDPAEPIDYSSFLVDKISDAIISASKLSQPSDMYFSSGECKGIAFNRRFKMKDGSIGWNPGKLNPQISEPLGPVDESVPVLSITQGSTEIPSAILTGFAMHLAILDDAYYGADYPYYLDKELKSTISPDLFTHFLQSPCCEVNHVDVSSPEPQIGHQWAEVVGEKLAVSVIESLKDKKLILQPDLKVESLFVPLELQEFPEDEIETQRQIWHSPDRINLHFLEVVHAGKVASIYDRHKGGPVGTLIQAFQFDIESVLIGLPSEVSVELGLYIKTHSPYKSTMIVQLSNDWFGYIPTRHIFEEGQYEAVVAKIKPGEGEQLADSALGLLKFLKNR